MNKTIRSLSGELRTALESIYGDRLKGAYLFGSYARGDEEVESDVDILIVLDRVEDYSREIDRTSEIISDLSLKYSKALSRVFASEDRWENDPSLFFQNVREEAVPA